MNSPTPAPAPDPVATANAQATSNKATATTQFGLDATNQVTPQGKLTYDQIGTWSDGTPRFQSTTSLNPQEQSIYDANAQTRQNIGQIGTDQSSRIASLLGTPFSFKDLPASVSNVQGGPIQSSINSAGPINSSIANAGNINNSIADAGNISGSVANAGRVQTSIGGDTSADRQRVEDAIYSRLNPQLDRDTAAMRTQLINSGVRPGSEAYQTAIDADNRSRNDARMQAVLAGGQEQSREFGIDQSKGQFANSAQGQQYSQNANDTSVANAAQGQRFAQNQANATFGNTAQQQQFTQNAAALAAQNAAQQQQYGQNANDAQFANTAQAQQFGQGTANATLNNASRQAGIGEQALLRETPINEISALLSGSQVSQPGFVSTPQPGVAPTDVIGAQQQALNQQNVGFNAQLAQQQALTNGLFGLGKAAVGGWAMSDMDTKENIEVVGTRSDGLHVIDFDYKPEFGGGKGNRGFMAQEVAQVYPEAVARVPAAGNRMAVNYSKVPARGLMAMGRAA